MTKLDHINITVQNLEDSIDWYKTLFGFEKVEGGIARGRKWAIVACNDSMIAMHEDASCETASNNTDRSVHRIYHFGLRVPEVEAWRAKVRDHRLKLNYGGEIEYPHSISWYIYDPSGHEIEVSCTGGQPLRFG